MRSNIKIILAVVITLIVCFAIFGGYMVYSQMQNEKNQLNNSLQEMGKQLNESQNNSSNNSNNNNSTQVTSTSKSSSSSSDHGGSVKSSSNKVTYEEAGVNKNVGYMKTCKYPGCGAVYDSRLSYCPVCGHKNIYV